MAYWLVKSEPEVYSIDALEADRSTLWDKVRNYQARNNLRAMLVGDMVLYYHSNCDPTGIVGIAKVASCAVPDPSQFLSAGEYFDPKATKAIPRWFAPELSFLTRFKRMIPLEELRSIKGLAKMVLLQRGSRLSVQPVLEREFELIVARASELKYLKEGR